MDASPKAPFLEDPPAYRYSDSSGPSTPPSLDGVGQYSILKKEETSLAIDPSLPLQERIQTILKRSFEWDFGSGFPNELTDLLNKTVNKQECENQFTSLCEVFLSFKSRQLLQRGRKAPYWLWHISDELIRDLEKKSGNLSDKEVCVTLKIMDCIIKKTTNTSKNIKKLSAIQTNFHKVEQIQNNALNFHTKFEEIKHFFEETISRAQACREQREQSAYTQSLLKLTPITVEQKRKKETLCEELGIHSAPLSLPPAQPPTRKRWWCCLCCV